MWGAWIFVAVIALGLSTILVAIVYALSELLMNDRMKGWAKLELAEVFYSAVIIAMAMTTLPLVDSVVTGALLGTGGSGGFTSPIPDCGTSPTCFPIKTTDTGTFTTTYYYESLDICGPEIAANEKSPYHGVESCHMRLGIWYLREVFEETKGLAFDVYLDYIRTSMMAEFTINVEFVHEMAGFFTFTPWRGFFTMGNKVKELCFDWAMKLMMLIKFQEVLLVFVAKAVFPAFFVIGTVLRTFSMTRKLGGLLLAMAIALYFVFPAFYAFGAVVMLDIKKAAYPTWVDPANAANPANQDSNPFTTPDQFPDPPIANVMFINGTLPIPGGGSTGYSTALAKDSLLEQEYSSDDVFLNNMEKGTDGSSAYVPMTDPTTGKAVDLSSTEHSGATDAEKDEKLIDAQNQMEAWEQEVAGDNKIDKFIDFAWSRNGPVDTMSRLTFWAVFFSLFSILATIAAIRSLSITFGGDIEIAGLTRLI